MDIQDNIRMDIRIFRIFRILGWIFRILRIFRIILEWIFRKWWEKERIVLIWLRKGTGGYDF
jgi:hypothetical protein